MTATQVRSEMLRAARLGDPIALSVVSAAAQMPDKDSQWVFEEYRDDPATMEYILRGMLKDD